MKCAKCGAELKDGCIYCSVCGHERQIVPDYNILEDELLNQILENETSIISKENHAKVEQPSKKSNNIGNPQSKNNTRLEKTAQNSKSHTQHANHNHHENEKKKSKIGKIIGITAVGAIIACGIIYACVSYSNKNSFTYQYNKGLACEDNKNYSAALDYFNVAQNIKPDNLDVRFEIADVYLLLGKDEKAENELLEIISIDGTNKKAYKKLIAIYAEQNDYTAITKLYQKVTAENIQALFADYILTAPSFSQKEGDYSDSVEIKITSTNEDAVIYYTIDGSSPVDNGEIYKDTVKFEEEGDYDLQAVCVDERGIYSDITKASYHIEYETPDSAAVTPDSGTYQDAQMITITVPEGCNAYYTWDGTAPTKESTLYTEPFEMLDGNNILSVIVVDSRGNEGSVSRYNYIYR